MPRHLAPIATAILSVGLSLTAGCIDDLPPATATPDFVPCFDLGPPTFDANGRPAEDGAAPEDGGRPTDARRPPPTDAGRRVDAVTDRPDDTDPPGPPQDAGPIDNPTPDLGAGRDADLPARDLGPIGCGGDELCNGVDDDCDGAIDEGAVPRGPGACGAYIARSCRVWLGFTTLGNSPAANAPAWGFCPDRARDAAGNLRCTDSGGDARFHTVALPARQDHLDEDTRLGVRFECDDDAVGGWVQQHCQVALGAFDNAGQPGLAGQNPTRCTLDAVGGNALACVRTNGDQRFHRLGFAAEVNDDTDLGAAFWCADANDPQRAADTERAVKLFFGVWSRHDNDNNCPGQAIDVADTWGDCPAVDNDDSGPDRCAGVVGGTGFGVLRPDNDVDACDLLTLALRINQGQP